MGRTLDRRALFRRFAAEAAEHVVTAAAREGALELPRRRRLPGAVAEADFLERCTRCLDCVRACPEGAVFTLGDSVGIGAGTPVLVPDERPCAMCEGFPCAAACETGALVVPEEPWVLGQVTVDEARCLPFLGPECGACASLCPTEPEALVVRRGRPDLDGALCVGCGRCIAACPVSPPALSLLPLE